MKEKFALLCFHAWPPQASLVFSRLRRVFSAKNGGQQEVTLWHKKAPDGRKRGRERCNAISRSPIKKPLMEGKGDRERLLFLWIFYVFIYSLYPCDGSSLELLGRKRWFVGRHFVQCFSLGSESCTRYRHKKQVVNNENKSLMTFQLVWFRFYI